MIIFSFDLETTGTDRQKDRVIEIGLALYSTGQKRILESECFLVDSDGVSVTEEITGITGLYQNAVETFGYSQEAAVGQFLEYYNRAEAVIGHNILRFDLPVIYNAMSRLGYDNISEKLAIDTMTDIPGVKGEQLITMCAKAGFTYKAHGAAADVAAVLGLAEYHAAYFPERSWDKIVERAKSPLVVLLSKQPNTTATNKVARKAGFRWNGDFKIWWQAIKEMDVENLAKTYPFAMEYAPKDQYPLDVLRDDN